MFRYPFRVPIFNELAICNEVMIASVGVFFILASGPKMLCQRLTTPLTRLSVTHTVILVLFMQACHFLQLSARIFIFLINCQFALFFSMSNFFFLCNLNAKKVYCPD